MKRVQSSDRQAVSYAQFLAVLPQPTSIQPPSADLASAAASSPSVIAPAQTGLTMDGVGSRRKPIDSPSHALKHASGLNPVTNKPTTKIDRAFQLFSSIDKFDTGFVTTDEFVRS